MTTLLSVLITTLLLTAHLKGVLATSPLADNQVCPEYSHDCVPFYQCIDGVIDTSGIGVINIRAGNKKECLASDGLVCCQIPGSFSTPPPTQPPVPIVSCSNGQTCVSTGLCKTDGTVNTDGAGLIDIRRHPDCYVDPANGIKGICCTLAAPLLDTCPDSNTECVALDQCTTEALTDNNGYVPYTQGGSWTGCRLGNDYNTAGVCCTTGASLLDTCPGSNTECVPSDQCTTKALTDINEYVSYNQQGSWAKCRLGDHYNTEGVCCDYGPCGVRHDNDVTIRTQYTLQKGDASFGEFPWQAIIFYTNFTFACGATLIDRQWLVTAAHCVNGLGSGDLRIRLGEWRVDNETEPFRNIDVDISQITVHKNASQKNLHNDIALIQLAQPIQYKYHINRVCLPTAATYVAAGTRCFASGWGKHAFNGGNYQAILKKIEVPVVDHYSCQNQLRQTRLGRYFVLDPSFVCAGGEANKDVCKGDGGGPLVCQDEYTGNYFLYGITAWGIGCGEEGVPGVYVNVQQFSEWIQDLTNIGY